MDKLNENALKVYSIFFGGGTIWEEIEKDGYIGNKRVKLKEHNGENKYWLTLKDASRIFNPKMSKKSRNERIVQYNFSKFKKLEWLDNRKEKRICIRTSKKGKETKILYEITTYRANYNIFFNSKIETQLKSFLLFFLEKNRGYLTDTYPEDIPKGIEELIKQLFLTSIILKKNKIKKELYISKINLDNYQEVMREIINEYHLKRMSSDKKGKVYSKKLKELYPKRILLFYLNLFAQVMIKLFFKEGFTDEVVKTSPEIYFWLCKSYDYDFYSSINA